MCFACLCLQAIKHAIDVIDEHTTRDNSETSSSSPRSVFVIACCHSHGTSTSTVGGKDDGVDEEEEADGSQFPDIDCTEEVAEKFHHVIRVTLPSPRQRRRIVQQVVEQMSQESNKTKRGIQRKFVSCDYHDIVILILVLDFPFRLVE